MEAPIMQPKQYNVPQLLGESVRLFVVSVYVCVRVCMCIKKTISLVELWNKGERLAASVCFNKVRMQRFGMRIQINMNVWVRGWRVYPWVCVCVCVLFFMPACCSDLPITRSIKSLIPKVHASNSTTWKKLSPREKKKSKSFLSCCLKPKPPVQHALEHEDGNVFYLHHHTSRGLMCTLYPGTSNFCSCWASKDELKLFHKTRNVQLKPFLGLGLKAVRRENSSNAKGSRMLEC